MAPDEPKPAGPIALRIKLRYDDVETMVQRFACNVGRSGLFLPTRSLQPVGTEIKFELRISNDTPVLVGLGRVKSAKAPDPANPQAAFGMAIELMRVTREGREVIIRMIERRRQLGLPEVAIPMPEDIESARRMDVETQPRAEVPRPLAIADSGAIAQAPPARPTPAPGDSLLTSPRPASGPIATARGRSDRAATPVLAPEPVRAKRPKLADLVAKAAELSGRVRVVDELDDQVDVGKAMARARALAGGDLDIELDALREASAAPIEVSVEAASAELARQLGGASIVRRDQPSARWAPPPAIATTAATASATATAEITGPMPLRSKSEIADITGPLPRANIERATHDAATIIAALPIVELEPPAVPEPSSVARRLPTASGEMDELAQEAAIAIAGRAGGAVTAIERPDVEPEVESPAIITEPAVALEAPTEDAAEREDHDLRSFERALDAARIHTGTSAAAPEPDPADDDIPELDSMDLELADDIPGESTQVGDNPALAHEAGYAQGLEEPPPTAAYDPFAHEHPAQADPDQAAADFDEEEISDLDVLAEADADDDDLLVANGERDSSGHPIVVPLDEPGDAPGDEPPAVPLPPIYPPPSAYPQVADYPAYAHAEPEPEPELFERPRSPSYPEPYRKPAAYGTRLQTPSPSFDFAARLDLDDADEFDEAHVHGNVPAPDRGRSPSAAFAIAARYPSAGAGGTFDDPQGRGVAEDFDEPHPYAQHEDPAYEDPEVEFDEQHGFGRRAFELADETPPPQPERAADLDLENALSTLDVDLDQLEVPRDRRRPVKQARVLPGMPPARPSTPIPAPANDVPTVRPGSGKPVKQVTQPLPRSRPRAKREVDDGVLIDFDDDDDE